MSAVRVRSAVTQDEPLRCADMATGVVDEQSPTWDRFSPPPIVPAFAPAWLRAATVAAGQRPIDLANSLEFVFLRNKGVSGPLTAFTFPHFVVRCYDDDPGRVEELTHLGEVLGLRQMSVQHLGSSWWDLGPGRQRQADVLVLDELLCRVDDDDRQGVPGLVRDLVRPGGLVVVSYRTVVGWSELVPLRALWRLVESWQPGATRGLVAQLRALEGGFFAHRQMVGRMLDEWAAGWDGVAEAVLADELEPMNFGDVSGLMSAAGCIHVAGLQGGTTLSEDLVALLDDVRDQRLREAMFDVAATPVRRVEVYRRGGAGLHGVELENLVRSLAVVADPSRVSPWQTGSPTAASVALDRLSSGARLVGDLVDDDVSAAPVLGALLSTGVVWPMIDETSARSAEEAREATTRLSRATSRPVVVAPRLGWAVESSVATAGPSSVLETLGVQ